jgi:hypothetical protein
MVLRRDGDHNLSVHFFVHGTPTSMISFSRGLGSILEKFGIDAGFFRSFSKGAMPPI